MRILLLEARSIRRAVLLLLLCVSLLAVGGAAADMEGREYLQKGKTALDAGRYEEASSYLSRAAEEFPLLEDYALLFLAEARHGAGDHGAALDAVLTLLTKYPESPLQRKARALELREARDTGSPDQLRLHESYVRDFPDDEDALLAYGKILRSSGDEAQAVAVFRRLYRMAGIRSSAAAAELPSSAITTGDMTEKAGGLMKRFDFPEAERLLREVLDSPDCGNRKEVLRSLGMTLFRQKKYREAASVFGRAQDRYYKARSLYRSGGGGEFEAALRELVESDDRQAGNILLAVAADKRREMEYSAAVSRYEEVARKYPADAEEARWGIGWTHYRSGEFSKAAEAFALLHGEYQDPKYLYWQARSAEAAGEDASPLYGKLLASGINFYSVMSHALGKGPLGSPVSYSRITSEAPVIRDRVAERVDALISLDMKREAVLELDAASRKASAREELLFLMITYQSLGEFRRAIGLASRLPVSDGMHRFWYPLAFWDIVEGASRKNGIDPFVALAVMREESRFDAVAKSPAGAYGLMQLMPSTAYRLDRTLKLGLSRPSQLTDARTNISLGTFYLNALLREFRSVPHALAAYNAGEAAVHRWQDRGAYKSVDEFIEDIPYPETRNYVKKVILSYFQYSRASGNTPAATDFRTALGGLSLL